MDTPNHLCLGLSIDTPGPGVLVQNDRTFDLPLLSSRRIAFVVAAIDVKRWWQMLTPILHG